MDPNICYSQQGITTQVNRACSWKYLGELVRSRTEVLPSDIPVFVTQKCSIAENLAYYYSWIYCTCSGYEGRILCVSYGNFNENFDLLWYNNSWRFPYPSPLALWWYTIQRIKEVLIYPEKLGTQVPPLSPWWREHKYWWHATQRVLGGSFVGPSTWNK